MTARRLTPWHLRRRLGALLLVLAVSAAHWWVASQLPDSRLGEGAADDMPEAIEVAFVRELAPAAPPVFVAAAQPRPAPAPVARPPRPAASAASQPPPAASEPVETAASAVETVVAAASAVPPLPTASAAASAPVPALADAASEPAASAPVAAAAASAAASGVAFDWPPSTRLSYTFEGYSMGPVYGNAKVEWLREGSRYQVRLEVRVPPLGGRRMVSDGQLGPLGLAPRRYDEETDRLFHDTARVSVLFEPDRIQLANGKVNDPIPGVQDTASQFVQMTWLFLTRPELLQPGRVVEFPLALPRRIGRWTYDVREPVDLQLPFGAIKAYHLEPRPTSRRGKEWLVDIWIAPSLQYLPARITLRQDAENYGELTLKSLPLQAGAAPAAASGASRIVR
ncbi:DUF3108 domain-containing protein [Ideonella sp. YS5]|uniref:DUF3108 domain-containing protein n=1 Tax=Ideonella sp. YS5 TaxID=3453714 RepID=UPI003EEDD407